MTREMVLCGNSGAGRPFPSLSKACRFRVGWLPPASLRASYAVFDSLHPQRRVRVVQLRQRVPYNPCTAKTMQGGGKRTAN